MTAALRDLVRETRLTAKELVMPYFVEETNNPALKKPIESMPGQYRYSLDELVKAVGADMRAGLRSCLLFGIPDRKDAQGSGAYANDGIVQRAVRRLKDAFPDLVVITDVCLCEYTDHGHCGLLGPGGEVRNDATLRLLARAAVSHARAGADIVAPSDMMDGRVAAVREALDEGGFHQLPIMSYAVKYAGPFYGPFREAANSAPQSGDRKSYQMDSANRREALREAAADAEEGADILMVKPAGLFLDIIREVRDAFEHPVAAYQVSGEYSMLKAAGAAGWIDEHAMALESLVAIKRAGADIIITYYASELLQQGLIG